MYKQCVILYGQLVYSVCLGVKQNTVNKDLFVSFSFSFNRTTQSHTVPLCLSVADPATFLASKRILKIRSPDH